MAMVRDSFVDLERHRQKLEDNVVKLEEALDEWRQWTSEYEALREQVKTLPPDAPRAEVTRTRQLYEGDLVDEKVLEEIFGKNDSKKPTQIVSVLSNRIDYVTKNVATLEKQFEAATNKLAAANVISDPDMHDEEGLPISEIMEELDDDDNVVSWHINRPGDKQPQILEALAKAGIKNLPTEKLALPDPSEVSDVNATHNATTRDIKNVAVTEQTTDTKQAANESSQPKSTPEPKAKPKKKGVTFTEDTKSGEDQQKSKTAEKIEEIMRIAKNQESELSRPVIPTNETEEEAQLRRDMLEYNLSTMNPIVAELQLEEVGSDEDDEDLDWDESSEMDEDDEYEDQWGRSTRSVLSPEYQAKMKELQERLNQQTLAKRKAKESAHNNDDEDNLREGIGRIVIKRDEQDLQDLPTEDIQVKPTSDLKKGVRFAQTLDIADDRASPVETQPPPRQPQKPTVDPLSDVIERKGTRNATPTTQPTGKVSRFKMGKSNGTGYVASNVKAPTTIDGAPILPERPPSVEPFAPSGPEGKTIAESVLERKPSSTAKEPDEFDAGMLQQQVAVEYRKMHNKMIYKQGGFLKENESPIRPLDEEEGGPKRISRFKAARLAHS